MSRALSASDQDELHGPGAPELGKRLEGLVVAGTYRLGRCIGAGATSRVFEAEHVRLGRQFAVKVLRAELEGNRAARRFRREATAIARLQSEHVVSIIDCGELEDGTPYLVMERLEGSDLRRLLAQTGPLPARRAVHLVSEACRGLCEVHRAGFVHRDLKPENLFITRRSTGQDWCKILDFGVAKLDASIGTAQGAIVGTVRYMAPEQLTDSSSISPATDLYAMGAILFECLVGRALVRGATVQETMFQIMNASPRELLGDAKLPEHLEQVILACLEKSPERRPASAAELIDSLTSALGTTAASTDSTLLEDEGEPASRPRRSARASARPLAFGALLTTTLIGACIGWQVAPREKVANAAATPSGEKNVAGPSHPREQSPPASSAGAQSSTATASPPSPLPLEVARPTPRRRLAAAEAMPAGSKAPNGVGTPLDRFDRANPYGD